MGRSLGGDSRNRQLNGPEPTAVTGPAGYHCIARRRRVYWRLVDVPYSHSWSCTSRCGCGGDGSPGGGFFTSGTPSGGGSYLGGALGDNTERPDQCVDSGLGGFGGGGNGGNGGGGGGGYEGGDGGGLGGDFDAATGRGGESYNDGANPLGEDGVSLGEGSVTITRL